VQRRVNLGMASGLASITLAKTPGFGAEPNSSRSARLGPLKAVRVRGKLWREKINGRPRFQQPFSILPLIISIAVRRAGHGGAVGTVTPCGPPMGFEIPGRSRAWCHCIPVRLRMVRAEQHALPSDVILSRRSSPHPPARSLLASFTPRFQSHPGRNRIVDIGFGLL